MFIVFPSLFLPLVHLSWVVTHVADCVPEIKTVNIFRIPNKGTPAKHDTQACCYGLMLNYVSIFHYFMGNVLSLYHTQRLITTCALDRDVTGYS